jgi:hypothetical protein
VKELGCMNSEQECDDSCPLLKKCVKYRLEPEEVVKLALLVNEWEKNKKSMEFFAAVGRFVVKMRGSING